MANSTAHEALYTCARKLFEENALDACIYVAKNNTMDKNTPWNFFIKNCILLNEAFNKLGEAEHAYWRQAAETTWKENFLEADQKKDMQKLDELKKNSEEMGLFENGEMRFLTRATLMEQALAGSSKGKERRVEAGVDDAVGQGDEPGEASGAMVQEHEGIDHMIDLSINPSHERVTSETPIKSLQNTFPASEDDATSSEDTETPMFNLFTASEDNATSTTSAGYLSAKRSVRRLNKGGAAHAHEFSKSLGK